MKKILSLVSMIWVIIYTIPFCSCSSDDIAGSEPFLIVKFKFDPEQERLNNIGQPAELPEGHAAQTPDFKKISAHYFELTPQALTPLGEGLVLYYAPETTLGGARAIDFSQSKIVAEDETFLKIPLSQVTPGSYQWVRVSLSYQNYKINIFHQGVEYPGTLESFLGYNQYIGTHAIDNNVFQVNGNRLQGYWAFALENYPYAVSGQAPPGATTVPNPLFETSPIPQGSCVVTGKFPESLVITGSETRNVVVTLSLSINQSFEWVEQIPDGKFEPGAGEQVIDMGIRGLQPAYVK